MEIEELFNQVTQHMLVDHPRVEPGRIFHSTGLKTGGKFFAFVSRGDLVVKLPAPRVDELLAGGNGVPFEGSRGRTMKEWIRLQPPDEAACAAYVSEAYQFARARAKK